MHRLATDQGFREALGREAFAYWHREHRLELMADDYRRVLRLAASLPAPEPHGLPAHVTDDGGGTLRTITGAMGVDSPFEHR
jgi:hypothetical protein